VNLCETEEQSGKNKWDMLKQSLKKPSIWFPKHLNSRRTMCEVKLQHHHKGQRLGNAMKMKVLTHTTGIQNS
jgi:hypothetical protein